MPKVIINADDFGYSRAVNFGIIDAHKYGVVTSATIMANMPGFEHAIKLAKQNPNLGVGVHLTLTCGRPLLNDLYTLVDEDGNFNKLSFYLKEFFIDPDELFREWDAQIKKVLNTGITITHLDSHHHIHTYKTNQDITIKLAKKYNLPVRANIERKNEVVTTDYFEGRFDIVGYDKEIEIQGFKQDDVIKDLKESFNKYDTIEIMCHPAYLDVTLYEGSSFALPRIKQVEFLIKSSFARYLKTNEKIQLCNFNILKLQ